MTRHNYKLYITLVQQLARNTSNLESLNGNILLILKTIANFLLTVAMVSIGFNISIKNIFQKSSLILLVALIGFIIQVVIAILIIDII